MIEKFWTTLTARHSYFTVLVLGHIAAYGMGPFFIWGAPLIAISLFWLVWSSLPDGTQRWKIALLPFLFGFGFFVSSLWWIGNALLVGGNDFIWAYPLAVCGLPILLALFPMTGCILSRKIAKGRSLSAYSVFLLFMFLAELARGTLFTGFPWNFFGMAWTNNLPMLQILSVGSVYLLTLLSLFWFTAPAFVIKGDASKFCRGTVATIAVITFLGAYLFGVYRLNTNPTDYNKSVVVQMIQPNIAQEDKWNPDKTWDNLRKQLNLIEPFEKFPDATTRAIILPETALTYHDFQSPQAFEALRDKLQGYNEKNVYLLSGALLRDTEGYHNSLITLDKDANFLQSFDKFHLVPFGEYIPFQKYIPIPTITQFSGFVEGTGPQTIHHANLPAYSPLVCYEVIFPAHVTAQPRPAWMVNVTNDAWYGLSPGPYQHLAQAQYRAIEEGIPMVRVAGTGISAVIDAYGRIVAASGLEQEGNIESLLPNPAPETIFAKFIKRFEF